MTLLFDDSTLKKYTITLTEKELRLLRDEYRQNVEWFLTGKDRNYGLLKEELRNLRERLDDVFYSDKGEYHVSTSFGSPSDAYKYFYIYEPGQQSPLTIDDTTKNPFSVLKEQLDILKVWTAEEVLIVLTSSDKIALSIDECITLSKPFKIVLTKWIDFLPENRFTVMTQNNNVLAIIPHYKFNENMDKNIFKSITETLNRQSLKDGLLDVIISDNKIRVLSTAPNMFNFRPIDSEKLN